MGRRALDLNDLLAEIYGWFTEGFVMKDLQEAKALLEELIVESAENPHA
jgi:predicted ATPase